MNVEKLLNIAADSQKMGDWGDGLTFMVNSAKGSAMQSLSDDELMQVAGGIGHMLVKKDNKKE